MEDTKYCICCGEDVPYNRIERQGLVELTCNFCGFPLPEDEKPVVPMQDLSQSSEQAQNAAPTTDKFSHVLIADDSNFTRKMIRDLLVEKGLADEILDYENGLELTSSFAKLVSENNLVDAVIIIDINMPVMDGISAARFIRNIESQKGMPHVPIAFFSSVKADENLREAMLELAPAHYVNKASDPNPDKLLERVEQLLAFFMQMR